MKRILSFLLGRGRRRVVDMHRLCGERLAVSEVETALHGQGADGKVRAVLQVVAMTREGCLAAAQDAAWKNGNPNYHLGGVEALEDVMRELAGLIETGRAGDEAKGWFGQG